mgnify:CR=1 FL=1
MPGHENARGTLLTPPMEADNARDVRDSVWSDDRANEWHRQVRKRRGEDSLDSVDTRLLLTPRPSAREAALPYLIGALLLGFGAYQSVLYFGHKPIPNPDVTAFLRVGRELLSLQVPSSFKRAPVVGLLQVGLSRLVRGPHPELTAGWLLNAILHPFSVVLLWLIARRIIGRAGCWVALIVAMNPWTLQNLREPIAETTLYFFILVTFFCILTRSRWRYVLASAATMVRYDAAALILVAFILDLVRDRSVRGAVRAFAYAAAASIPLGIWLLGTVMNFQDEGSTHYLRELGSEGSLGSTLVRCLAEIWAVVILPLFRAPESLPTGIAGVFAICVGIPVLVGFCFGVIQAVAERHREVLGLLAFLLVYIVVHTLHSFILARFCSMVHWIFLIVAVYGLRSIWLVVRKELRLSARWRVVLQGAAVTAIVLWAVDGASLLPDLAQNSARSVSMPYFVIATAVLFLLARWLCRGVERPMQRVLVLALVVLVTVSNQWTLARVMGNGRTDLEFKLLVDWFRDNAGPKDKLLTTYAGVLGLYLPDRQADLIHTGEMRADDPNGFIENCRARGITYIAWDSRLGLEPTNRYYGYYSLGNLSALAAAEDSGPYEFVTQFKVSPERYINLFRLWESESTESGRAQSSVLGGAAWLKVDPRPPAARDTAAQH